MTIIKSALSALIMLFIVITLVILQRFPANSQDMDSEFSTLSTEDLSHQFKKMRTLKGHFDGAERNQEVDSWRGRKHRLMRELGRRLQEGDYNREDTLKLLGQPDEIVHKGDSLFQLIVRQGGFDERTAVSYEYLFITGGDDMIFFMSSVMMKR